MKTYVSDLIPKLQRFSQKLDNLTLLINQHWIVVDESSNNKVAFIFRDNNELVISQNGIVEKAKWEFIGNNSLLIDRKQGSYLYKHGFFDETILALKVDGLDEYALLINENKANGELNSQKQIIDFLSSRYLNPNSKTFLNKKGFILDELTNVVEPELMLLPHYTNKGTLYVEQSHNRYPDIIPGRKAFIEGKPAPNGKYRIGFLWFVHIIDGQITKTTMF